MAVDVKDFAVGMELPPVSKYMTQDKFNAYEACGKRSYRGIHEDEEVAKKEGLGQTIASGMMSVMYLHEPMIKAFGVGWEHGGKLRLSFVRPTLHGDTLTVRTVVKEIVKEKIGDNEVDRVVFDAWLENQREEKVSVGWASGLVGPTDVLRQFSGGFGSWLKDIPAAAKVKPDTQIIWERIVVGEDFGPYEYTPMQEDLDEYRAAAEDQTALFTTVGRKHHSELYNLRYVHGGGINAGHESTNINPPTMGKKLKVYGKIPDKYIRRDKPYVMLDEYTIDEDGREIESAIHRSLRDPKECGKKWWGDKLS